MNDMLKGLKADLTDRRMLPLVGIVVAALIAAIAYAALGGSSSSTPPAPSASTALPTVPHGIAVTEDQSSDTEAVAETTDGAKTQRGGASRDPFHELPDSITGNKAPETSGSSTSVASSSSASSSSTSSTSSTEKHSSESSGGGSTKPAAPHKQSKPTTIYHVALEFGVVPAGPSTEPPALTPYTALSKATPLPSPKERLIEFVGVTVTHGGQKSASFAIDGELILKGSGACLPSTTQCQVVDLPVGASEQMEYFSPSGALVNYELRVVSITSSKASAADVKGVLRAQGLISHHLLGDGGALHEAGLRFSSLAGVLVFSPHKAKSARASIAIAR